MGTLASNGLNKSASLIPFYFLLYIILYFILFYKQLINFKEREIEHGYHVT